MEGPEDEPWRISRPRGPFTRSLGPTRSCPLVSGPRGRKAAAARRAHSERWAPGLCVDSGGAGGGGRGGVGIFFLSRCGDAPAWPAQRPRPPSKGTLSLVREGTRAHRDWVRSHRSPLNQMSRRWSPSMDAGTAGQEGSGGHWKAKPNNRMSHVCALESSRAGGGTPQPEF